jgi:DNA-binding MarR family transcriptional regulator
MLTAMPPESNSSARLPGMSEQSLALDLEHRIHTLAALLRSDEARKGFSPSEWLVLSELEKTSSLSLNELAVRANTGVGGTSRIMRKLSLLHLAEWRKIATNRRQYELSLTAHGREVHARLSAQATSETSQAIKRMSQEDLLLVMGILAQCMPGSGGGERD